jgi:hypothetical protein
MANHVFSTNVEGGDCLFTWKAGNDLLALAGQTTFLIETPEAYRLRIEEEI